MPPDSQAITDEERGVAYGKVEDEPLLLDVFRPPARAAARPAVVLVHGGGMWTGSRADMADPARHLAQAGYVAFAVDYRLVDAASGRHRWPAQLDDVQQAVRWVRANAAHYGVDPGRVGAYGWSAGGQLAALLGMRDTRDAGSPLPAYPSRVACVVDLAGDVDLAAYISPPALDEVVALLGGTPARVPERYRDASPLSWIDARTAPSWSSTAPRTTWFRSRSRGGWCPPSRRPGSRWSTRNCPTPATAIWTGPGSAQRRSRSSGATCAPATLTLVDPQAGYSSSTSQGAVARWFRLARTMLRRASRRRDSTRAAHGTRPLTRLAATPRNPARQVPPPRGPSVPPPSR